LHTLDLSAQLGNYLLDPQNAIEVLAGQRVVIYPNPTQGDVYFVSSTPPSRYQWINAQGKIVEQGSIMFQETSIGTQKLDAGNYLLKLQGPKGQIQTFQVIVR
jgi:hypothetical protein